MQQWISGGDGVNAPRTGGWRWALFLAMALGSAGGRAAGVEGNPGTVLTDILSARARLNRDVSEGQPPIRVRFEGVITFVDPALEA